MNDATDQKFAIHVTALAAGVAHPDLVPHDLLHGAIGIATESGEIMDAVKRALFYGKPFDRENIIEELGDLLWYIQVAANGVGVSMQEIRQANITKLEKRYPAGFSMEAALARADKQQEAA